METSSTFRALILTEEDGQTHANIQTVEQSALPTADTLIRVAYSGLNYKDGLAILGRNRVVRSFPMVPGIDLSGVIEETTSPDFKPGDRVVSTGWGLGERHWGGMAQYARLKSEWLVKVPDELSLAEAMGVGTPGFTAML
ncbi:MAG TPA: alcohol dehydrogenase catalytic domain-containing protein, partial [Ktedonobacterales bacterium]|nr:alcohol dehydrogenase catalytic domain-containing protein [Ktedonobacterales bacterium]